MNDYWKAFWDCKPIRIIIFSFLIFTTSIMFGEVISSFIGFDESNRLNDLVAIGFFVLIIIITITFSLSDHYNFQFSNFLIKAIILICYVGLRFNIQNNFVTFYWSESIYYIDIVLFFILIFPFTPLKKTVENSIDHNNERFDPVIHLDHSPIADRLNRESLIKQIHSYILSTPPLVTSSSVNISLTGDWGSGKTYIKEQLKEYLNEKSVIYKKEKWTYFFIDFTPWSISDKSTINEYFIKELLLNLSKADRNLASLFKQYFNTILNISDNGYVNFVKASRSLFFPELGREKLSDKLRSEKIKIIVFIDDIDRLHREEILDLLKFIRNNGDISGITYICLFDQDYVLNKIGEENEVRFLRKFFNLNISVGSGQINFYKEFEDLLFKYIQDPDHKRQLDWMMTQLDDLSKHNFKKSFGTIRDMKVFFNNFLFVYQYRKELLSKNFISVIDLFLLEQIKYNYPKEYRLLYSSGKSYDDIFNGNNFENDNTLKTLKGILLDERPIEIDSSFGHNRVRDRINHALYFGELDADIFNMQEFLASFNNSAQFIWYTSKHKNKADVISLIFDRENYSTVDQKSRFLMLVVRHFCNDEDIKLQHIYGFLRQDSDVVSRFIKNLDAFSVNNELKDFNHLFIADLLYRLKLESNYLKNKLSENIFEKIQSQLEWLFNYSLKNSNIKTNIQLLDYTNELVIKGQDGEKHGQVKKELLNAFAMRLHVGSDEDIIRFIKLLPIPRNAIINFDKNSLIEEWVLRPFAADVFISSSIQEFKFLTIKSEGIIKSIGPNEQEYLLEILNSIPESRIYSQPINEIRISNHKLTLDFKRFLSQNYRVEYLDNKVKNESDLVNIID